MEKWRHGDMEMWRYEDMETSTCTWRNRDINVKAETQAIFLNFSPFAHCANGNCRFSFVDEVPNRSYPVANRLNMLKGLFYEKLNE